MGHNVYGMDMLFMKIMQQIRLFAQSPRVYCFHVFVSIWRFNSDLDHFMKIILKLLTISWMVYLCVGEKDSTASCGEILTVLFLTVEDLIAFVYLHSTEPWLISLFQTNNRIRV